MGIDTISKKALDGAIAAWNAGDLPGYLELYADTIRLHGYGPEAMDKAAVTGFYRAIFASFPDARLTVHDELWAGGRAALRATMTGTHHGDFNGIPPTRTAIVLPVITILQFEGPVVVERWSQSDMLGLMVQLGALPAPG